MTLRAHESIQIDTLPSTGQHMILGVDIVGAALERLYGQSNAAQCSQKTESNCCLAASGRGGTYYKLA